MVVIDQLTMGLSTKIVKHKTFFSNFLVKSLIKYLLYQFKHTFIAIRIDIIYEPK